MKPCAPGCGNPGRRAPAVRVQAPARAVAPGGAGAEPEENPAALSRRRIDGAAPTRTQAGNRRTGAAAFTGSSEPPLVDRLRPRPARLRSTLPHPDVIDDVTKECLAAVADTSISGKRVARELTALVARRGRPAMIVSDHGTEFTSNAMLGWA